MAIDLDVPEKSVKHACGGWSGAIVMELISNLRAADRLLSRAYRFVEDDPSTEARDLERDIEAWTVAVIGATTDGKK